jgi:hypothetical protein
LWEFPELWEFPAFKIMIRKPTTKQRNSITIVLIVFRWLNILGHLLKVGVRGYFFLEKRRFKKNFFLK